MMRLLLLTEGSSDVVLLKPLRWLLDDIDPTLDYTLDRVDFSGLPMPPRTLADRMLRTFEIAAPDLMFVHRDADRQDPNDRRREIGTARESSGIDSSCLPVIPVSMTESWFLFDEAALRRAAGNPAGRMQLELPSPERLVSKRALFDVLEQASGTSGRRRKRFRPEEAFHRMAELIDDFSALDELDAFRRVREDLTYWLRTRSEDSSR